MLRRVFGKSMVAFLLQMWMWTSFGVSRPWGLKRAREEKSREGLVAEAMESESCIILFMYMCFLRGRCFAQGLGHRTRCAQ